MKTYIIYIETYRHIKIYKIYVLYTRTGGLPRWLRGKESACQGRRRRFSPWVEKIPWRRKWLPTLVFLPRRSHGQESLAGNRQSMGSQRIRHD